MNTKETASANDLRLWYQASAKEWVEALPVGNGHLGAMVFGGVKQEQIQFNEDTLWTGGPHDYANPGSHQYLSTMRNLLFEGKQEEAEELGSEKFMSVPLHQERFQPFGDVWIDFDGNGVTSDYYRDLDLNTGIATVKYQQDGVNFTRSVFCSFPDKAMVIHLTADQPKALNCRVGVGTLHEESEVKIDQDTIVLSGKVSDYANERDGYIHQAKMTFQSQLKVYDHNGSLEEVDGKIAIKEADSITLVLVAATNFNSYEDVSGNPAERCDAAIAAITDSYEKMLEKHIADHQALFGRVTIDLGSSDQINKPTDVRIVEFFDAKDPHLVSLLYQYGRYMMVACSRPGTQPANLQGVWNDLLQPPWDSKYTININAQMNYWPAESGNLSECHEPLLQLVEDCAVTGQNIAKEHYDCRGWVVHHNTDLWRGAAPINASNHGIWIVGGAWLCQHIWWHYEFTQNKNYLEKAYPTLKNAALFFVDYLIEDPRNDKGWLISGPSNSPEQGGLVMGPSMDHQIIRNLLANCIEAADILGVDAELREQLQSTHDRIAPDQIGQHGQLQEWLEDVDDPENDHRHISHLWALHPGGDITQEKTPELFDAVRKSLEMRGDGATGWSMGWKVNCWAYLKDGNHAFILLRNLLSPACSDLNYGSGGAGVYPNLFDAHPPFQIDGNFGATAGISEMLMQSHRRNKEGQYIIDLLPALPDMFATGSITGLRARGGFEVDVSWQDGTLVKATIRSLSGQPCTLQYKDKLVPLNLQKGEEYTLEGE